MNKMPKFDKENDYNRINTDYHSEDFSAPFAGYLYKRASSGKWQRRYFEINGNYLIYYKSHTMSKLLAAVSIPQLGDIKYSGAVKDEKGDGHVIQIDLKDKQYFLRTDTFEDAEKWITHLLYVRDGEVMNTELRRALNNSPTLKTVTFNEATTYNPQHDSLGNSHIRFGSISSDDTEEEVKRTPPARKILRLPKRVSDANWQKSNRSIFYCCFRSM